MIVKYELVYNLHKNSKVYLGEFNSNYTPAKGDIVNINGSPFIVYSVACALNGDNINDTYVYIDVFKAGSYSLNIGGIKC